MKRKIRLTESELIDVIKSILSEQDTIKVNAWDRKNYNNLVKKYCTAYKVNKNLIDGQFKNDSSELDVRLYKLKSEIIEKMDEGEEELKKTDKSKVEMSKTIKNKLVKLMDNIIKQIKPIMLEIISNTVYSHYGYATYQGEELNKKLMDAIYNSVNEFLEGNIIIKNLGKIFITKDNVEYIKKNVNSIVYQYVSLVSNILFVYFISPKLTKISNETEKVIPKCTKLTVVEDDRYNKLKPSQYFNPPSPIYNVDFEFIRPTNLLETYRKMISKKIMSYA